MTVTIYRNNTSLAAYTNALFEEKMKAVSRSLVDSVSFLQTQVQTVKTDTATVTAALSTIQSIQQSLNALETKCEDALTQMENIAVSYGNTWYGSLSSDPTENPWDNGPLMIGARYYNTTNKIIRIYTSSGWEDYDASDEQIQLEVANIYAKILTAQQAVNTAEQNTVSAANSVITPIKQFETLFPTPMVAGEIPVVNSAGTGFEFMNVGAVGGYIKAWSSTTASRGGYPQYAVVADPTFNGVLYMSTEDSNSTQPSFTNPVSEWVLLPPTRMVSVETFGVVDDPNQQNITTNTSSMQNAINTLNNTQGLIALYIPSGMSIYLNQGFEIVTDCRIMIDGLVTFTGVLGAGFTFYNNYNTNDTNNTTYIGGCGCISGSNSCSGLVSHVSLVIENVGIEQCTPYAIQISNAESLFTNLTMTQNNIDICINATEIVINGGVYDSIEFQNGSESTISNVTFSGSPNTCITTNLSSGTLSNVIFSGCQFLNGDGGGMNFTGSNDVTISDITIQNCKFANNGQTQNVPDIYLSYVSDFIIKDCVFEGTCSANTSISSPSTTAQISILKGSGLSSGLYSTGTTTTGTLSSTPAATTPNLSVICALQTDSNSSGIVIKGNTFKNIGQANVALSYGMNIDNSNDVTIDGNLFLNPKGTMVAPATGSMNSSWYIGNNTWNPNQFLNTTNVTNNPQNGLGIPFINTQDGFPQSVQTDIIRKTFNLEKIGTDWNSGSGSTPNNTTTPKSIIARKTSLGWVAKQAVWIDLSNLVPGQSWVGRCYWLVPFEEVWIDTAQLAIYESNSIEGVLYNVPTIACNGEGESNQLTTTGVGLQWYTVSTTLTTIAAYNASFKIEVEGLVDIQKVINLTSINQYLPS
ncbi:MAG: right-handed parallel beta-helix repeat-containing protein [Methanobrevibacter sp.]|nr:right-handed parallel beta-helix repeat-containing protein [Methanobrevibacter sp.]